MPCPAVNQLIQLRYSDEYILLLAFEQFFCARYHSAAVRGNNVRGTTGTWWKGKHMTTQSEKKGLLD